MPQAGFNHMITESDSQCSRPVCNLAMLMPNTVCGLIFRRLRCHSKTFHQVNLTRWQINCHVLHSTQNNFVKSNRLPQSPLKHGFLSGLPTEKTLSTRHDFLCAHHHLLWKMLLWYW